MSSAIKDAKIIEADFVAPKCYYLKLDRNYKGNDEYVRFKGVSNPTIKMIQDLRVKGKVNTL